jgi:ribonuclease HI
MNIEIFSDGSATTADLPGGWGAVILIDGVLRKELSGHLEKATNNDAELIGALSGLDYVNEFLFQHGSWELEFEVTLISDSQIILNWANGTYKFKQEQKMDLYDHLQRLVKKLKVKTKWVRGHSGNQWNERCDFLANQARLGLKEIDKPKSLIDTKIGEKKKATASLWYGGKLMVLDFEQGIIEPYNREAHGKRGSVLEIRENKDR